MKKKILLSLIFIFISFTGWCQITMTTTSSLGAWSPELIVNSGAVLTWTAAPNADFEGQTVIANDPVFDFSSNINNLPIDITITSSDGFTGLTIMSFFDDSGNESSITAIDPSEAVALEVLNVKYNQLSNIDISNNPLLRTIVVRGNQQLADQALNTTNNTQLTFVLADVTGITSVDFSTNTLLDDVRIYDSRLTSAVLDQVLIDLDNHGLSNGNLEIRNQQTGEELTPLSYDAYNSLIAKGWTIDVDSPLEPRPEATMTLTTISSFGAWSPNLIVNTGAVLTWTAAPNADFEGQTVIANDPTFDFSSNINKLPIDITITSPDGFTGLTLMSIFVDDDTGNGGLVTAIDPSEAVALEALNMKYNQLSNIDISNNPLLRTIVVRGNQQLADQALNTTNNTQLTYILADVTGITSVDLSTNTLLDDVRIYDSRLTSAVLDQVLIDLDNHGLSNGNLEIRNQQTGEELTPLSYDAYNSLIAKGWTIDVDSPLEPAPEATMTLTTTSSLGAWSPELIVNSGAVLTWTAAPNADFEGQTVIANDPVFDFSSNINNLPIDITITSSDGFTGLTIMSFFDDSGNESSITAIDPSEAVALEVLNVKYNQLSNIDISNNPLLRTIVVRGNQQLADQALNTTNNTQLTFVLADVTGITSVDFSTNTLLDDVRIYDSRLTSAVLDQVLIDLDNHGLSNGNLEIRNQQTGEELTPLSYDAYNSLIAKGWTIDVDSPLEPAPEATMTLTTTSSLGAWSPELIVNSGAVLTWTAAPNGDFGGQTVIANDPVFDFSSNINNLPIDITIASPDGFTGLTIMSFFDDSGIESSITAIDPSEAVALEVLNMKYNQLSNIDISNNPLLKDFVVRGNQQLADQALNTTNNTQLTFVLADVTGITSVDFSTNTLLDDVRIYDSRLTSAVLDQILIDLDNHGLSNGNLEIRNQQTGEELTFISLNAYDNLISKGWTIDVAAPDPASGPTIQITGNGEILTNANTPDITSGTDFGQVQLGSTLTNTFTVQNIGDSDLTLNFADLFLNSGGFSITGGIPPFPPGGTITILSGESVDIDITFTPPNLLVQTASLGIASDAVNEPNFTVNFTAEGIPVSSGQIDVQGNGISIVNGDTTPSIDDDTDFGQVENNNIQTNTFTIVNNDPADNLTISAIDLLFGSDSEFSIANINDGGTPVTLPYDIVSSSSITFDVLFAPTSSGGYDASIGISNSDTNENPFQFAIAGEGVENVVTGDLMITQYYRASNNTDRWIEVKNVSGGPIASDTYYLVRYVQGADTSLAPQFSQAIPAMGVGEVLLFESTTSLLPSDVNLGTATRIVTNVCNFGADDTILISTDIDATSYLNREDNVLTLPAISLIRGGSSNEVPEPDFDVSGWLAISPSGDVNNALPSQNIALGTQDIGDLIWDGNDWNGTTTPDFTRNVVIGGNYSGLSTLYCYNLTVNSGQTLDFNNGTTNSVVVNNNLTINGSFVIGDQESLVMTNNSAVISGNISKIDNSTVRSNARDITYWSSPVRTASISTVFSGVDPTRIFAYERANTAETDINAPDFYDVWEVASGVMTRAKGYAAEGLAGSTDVHSLTFTGVPHNGDIPFDVFDWPDGNDENDYNLIGNPYPSAINIRDFLSFNTGVIQYEIFLWTHNTPISNVTYGDFISADYASYNFVGGTAAITGGPAPLPNIGSAQGFMIRAREGASGVVRFNNSMRIVGQNDQFFKSGSTKNKEQSIVENEANRIWLNLTTDQGGFSQILVGFMEGATDGKDSGYDTKRVSVNPLKFYSVIEDGKFVIQGQGEFTDEKEVSLGFDTEFAPRQMTIGIEKLEGELLDSKVILVDNYLNRTHDLQKGDYSFNQTESGSFPDRFTLKFTRSNAGGNDNGNDKKMTVANKFETLKIEATDPVKVIKIYDVFGRIIMAKKPNTEVFEVNIENVKPGTVLILESVLDDGTILSKKVIKY